MGFRSNTLFYFSVLLILPSFFFCCSIIRSMVQDWIGICFFSFLFFFFYFQFISFLLSSMFDNYVMPSCKYVTNIYWFLFLFTLYQCYYLFVYFFMMRSRSVCLLVCLLELMQFATTAFVRFCMVVTRCVCGQCTSHRSQNIFKSLVVFVCVVYMSLCVCVCGFNHLIRVPVASNIWHLLPRVRC